DSGSVRATLRFRQRGDGWLATELTLAGDVELECQRCLEPFRYELTESVNVVLAASDSLPATVPAGFEPFELDEARLKPAELIEDETIVAIPLVPKHARIEDCGSLARKLAGQGERP
ncbi:MAG TPA: YceD family protein, partial [Gammaproteobacteria bacterium]|nr:YceD family protein [Gammaproteobacteria bacterium]